LLTFSFKYQDGVNGPGLKVKRKLPGKTCLDYPDTATVDDLCYTTMSFADQWGVFHDAQAMGSVVPSDYATTYIPYDQGNIKRLILIVRGQSLRVMYEVIH